ncbi:hypothetical protein AK812_SmicGene4141 [Symbiodinium microadriaticum]|uniref:Uncharacterized protein n=1 Tax=Symbiodinium microadriaticum TaxID=2951 RepID=A0A1Q9EX57_SYMMI|nr:hypothetical protein AK812_SmicGene4141 [Symbiodinium microadriaticum]
MDSTILSHSDWANHKHCNLEPDKFVASVPLRQGLTAGCSRKVIFSPTMMLVWRMPARVTLDAACPKMRLQHWAAYCRCNKLVMKGKSLQLLAEQAFARLSHEGRKCVKRGRLRDLGNARKRATDLLKIQACSAGPAGLIAGASRQKQPLLAAAEVEKEEADWHLQKLKEEEQSRIVEEERRRLLEVHARGGLLDAAWFSGEVLPKHIQDIDDGWGSCMHWMLEGPNRVRDRCRDRTVDLYPLGVVSPHISAATERFAEIVQDVMESVQKEQTSSNGRWVLRNTFIELVEDGSPANADGFSSNCLMRASSDSVLYEGYSPNQAPQEVETKALSGSVGSEKASRRRARSGTHMKKSLRKWNNRFRKVREHYITKEQGYARL